MSARMIEIEASESPEGLFDEPFVLRARSAGGEALTWRARYLDDDRRAWKAQSPFAERLSGAWRPGKPGATADAALRSLRPVAIDVRVEAADGRTAARTLTRRLLADGVKQRRWKGDVAGTLSLPAGPARGAVVVVGASPLPGALLASRGLVVLTVAALVDGAVERLTSLPAVTGDPLVLTEVPVPPNVGVLEDDPAARAAAWDELLAGVGAVPRRVADDRG